MYAAGYATAQDRLFLMDVLRRTAEGSTAELLGPSAIPADAATLGQFDLSPEELTAEVMRLPQDEGAAGERGLADLQQYVAGINAYIDAALRDPRLLPAEYPALGALPRAWTLADTAAEAYLLIAQFTVFGDAEHQQSDVLSRLVKRLGAAKGKQAYDDLRNLDNPKAPVTADRPFPSDRPAAGPCSAVPIDAESITPRDAVASQQPGVGVPGSSPRGPRSSPYAVSTSSTRPPTRCWSRRSTVPPVMPSRRWDRKWGTTPPRSSWSTSCTRRGCTAAG